MAATLICHQVARRPATPGRGEEEVAELLGICALVRGASFTCHVTVTSFTCHVTVTSFTCHSVGVTVAV